MNLSRINRQLSLEITMKNKALVQIQNFRKYQQTLEPLILAEMNNLIGGKTSELSYHNSHISIQNRMFERHDLAVAGQVVQLNNITLTICYPHEH